MTNEQQHTPELEPHCGSWIVTRNDTGAAVLETFSRKVADAVNRDRYTVQTAAQYLAQLNRTALVALNPAEPWPFPRSPLIAPVRAVKTRQKRKPKNLPDALL